MEVLSLPPWMKESFLERLAWSSAAPELRPLGTHPSSLVLFFQFSTLLFRAGTNCDLFVLTKTDLDTALSYYPQIAEQIRKVAGNRANLVKKRSQIAAKAAAEGKSASDAAKAAAQGTKDEDDEDDSKSKKPPAPVPSAPTSKPAAVQDKTTGGNTAEQGKQIQVLTFYFMFLVYCSIVEEVPSEAPSKSGCGMWCKTKLWPPMKKLLTFTIKNEGVPTILHLIGCLVAYFSAFTISYQVRPSHTEIVWCGNRSLHSFIHRPASRTTRQHCGAWTTSLKHTSSLR